MDKALSEALWAESFKADLHDATLTRETSLRRAYDMIKIMEYLGFLEKGCRLLANKIADYRLLVSYFKIDISCFFTLI